eukprot:1151676-Pelagomonas_calceolata.AAC.9
MKQSVGFQGSQGGRGWWSKEEVSGTPYSTLAANHEIVRHWTLELPLPQSSFSLRDCVALVTARPAAQLVDHPAV